MGIKAAKVLNCGYCTNCNAGVDETDRVCPDCGAEFEEEPLLCDNCGAEVTDWVNGLFHYSGTVNGVPSGHIHLCARCNEQLRPAQLAITQGRLGLWDRQGNGHD